jgi:HEAT repeat protein
VAWALGRIGPVAKDAVPVLLKAMKNGNQELQRSATEALRKIDPEAARKAAAQTKDSRK